MSHIATDNVDFLKPSILKNGVWAYADHGQVEISIHCRIGYAVALLTAEETDELIRALAAARVELSKEPPR